MDFSTHTFHSILALHNPDDNLTLGCRNLLRPAAESSLTGCASRRESLSGASRYSCDRSIDGNEQNPDRGGDSHDCVQPNRTAESESRRATASAGMTRSGGREKTSRLMKKNIPPLLSSLNKNGRPRFNLVKKVMWEEGRLQIVTVPNNLPEVIRIDGRLKIHFIDGTNHDDHHHGREDDH